MIDVPPEVEPLLGDTELIDAPATSKKTFELVRDPRSGLVITTSTNPGVGLTGWPRLQVICVEVICCTKQDTPPIVTVKLRPETIPEAKLFPVMVISPLVPIPAEFGLIEVIVGAGPVGVADAVDELEDVPPPLVADDPNV